MPTLLITVLTGIIFAFLATQNTTGVDVNIATHTFVNIPLYLVALGSLLIGLVASSIIQIFDSIGSLFTIHSKDTEIKVKDSSLASLENKVHELELENAKLRGEKGEIIEKDKAIEAEHHPNLLRRLQHNFIP